MVWILNVSPKAHVLKELLASGGHLRKYNLLGGSRSLGSALEGYILSLDLFSLSPLSPTWPP
jgi:hypothetical protein